jgi:hypothetical protein
MVLNGKTPVYGRGFFDSVFSLADGVKLLRNGDVACFQYFEWAWDLTTDFAGVFRGLFCKWLVLLGLDHDEKEGQGVASRHT